MLYEMEGGKKSPFEQFASALVVRSMLLSLAHYDAGRGP